MYKEMSDSQIRDCMDATAQGKTAKIQSAKSLVRFFSVSVEIKIFGVTIFKWQFPPEEPAAADPQKV